MKKISILIALALIVTIGGVYATWNYENENSVAESHIHMGLNMAGYSAGLNAKGSIEMFYNGMSILVDDEDNNKQPEIKLTGEMIFIFTPYNNAAQTIKDNGIPMQFVLGQSGTMQFVPDGGTENVNIFKFVNNDPAQLTPTKITAGNATTLYPGHDLSAHIDGFAVRIQASDVTAKIQFGGTFTLSTLTLYHDFQKAMGGGQIGLTVSEKTN